MPFWTIANIDRLKKLFADGLSFGQIGGVMGCSRNAAIGKAGRIGLTSKGRPIGYVNHKKVGRPAVKRAPSQNVHPGFWDIDQEGKPFIRPEAPPPPEMVRCSILELTPTSCRFPFGQPKDPGFFFCGNETGDKKNPYCPYHMGIAYNAPSPRRDGANTRSFAYGTKT
jgi:GcrA cell cycle regulator